MKTDSSISNRTQHNTQLRVSVIVPTFNRATYIEECLDSLLSQTTPPFEIIVIDDGSEDDTAIRLAAYGESIRYFYKTNAGKASAINLALTKARGDLIWFFDDDDVAVLDAIESRVAVLRDNPTAGFAYAPHFIGFNGANNQIERGALHNTPNHHKDVFFSELLKGCFFHLATALIRTEVIKETGGFDSDLIRAQDYDFQIRMAKVATPAFCPSPSFVFRQHDGIRGTKDQLHKSSERIEFFLKYDQVIGRKLRLNLGLMDYIVPRQFGELAPQQLRNALFARMVVMGSKGCIPEMIEDLGAALGLIPPGESLSAAECEIIASTVYTGYAYPSYRSNRKGYRKLIAKIPPHPCAPAACRCLAKGFLRLSLFPKQEIGERFRNIKEAFLLCVH